MLVAAAGSRCRYSTVAGSRSDCHHLYGARDSGACVFFRHFFHCRAQCDDTGDSRLIASRVTIIPSRGTLALNSPSRAVAYRPNRLEAETLGALSSTVLKLAYTRTVGLFRVLRPRTQTHSQSHSFIL